MYGFGHKSHIKTQLNYYFLRQRIFMRRTLSTLTLPCFLMAFCCTPVLNADVVVYEISAASPVGDNGANAGAANDEGLVDNGDGTFSVSSSTTSANNTATFINSGDVGSVNDALGRTLLPTDTVTVSLTVDSFIGNLNANGTEFGIVGGAGFREATNLLLQIDNDGIRGGVASFFNDGPNVNRADTPGVTDADIQDGFSVEAVYDINGITYTVSGVTATNPVPGDALTPDGYTYSLTAAEIQALSGDPGNAYDFVGDVGGGFAYYSFQTNTAGAETAVISNFTVDVASAVPEPSSVALLSLGAIGFLVRRRR